ncbi:MULTISPECIES: FKBP-type peptidyl-prolyl cis-trans isomerase [Cryobacterium]|uniref:FKBP-type peptidyl-prolyl cis-trans isomerase n=1 Tax=Cryobacterium TaxID=69578 RepID=UPI001F53E71C|nr:MULTISPECIES: FKBP-type peptidyl-prolyl cis-trans isomerase [Cryobacterium]
MRKLPALLAVATVAVLALTGCSGSPSSTPTASAAAALTCTDPGTSSDAVTVAGDAGVEPTVTFTAPLTTTATERTVITKGDGEAVNTGDAVEIAYTAYNATSGAKLNAGGYGTAAGLTVTVAETGSVIPGILKGIACSNIGSRVAVVVPPVDAFGTTGNTNLKVSATDNIIFVIDVKGKVPTRSSGTDQAPQDGFPTVVLADDGAPTITVPKADAPTELKTEVLKKGDGATVADGATVTVQYAGVVWATGTVFDQSWGKGGPATFATANVVPGFAQGLIGQTVGSQVVIVIPPALGYGSTGNTTAGISATDTLVFVVDILATA